MLLQEYFNDTIMSEATCWLRVNINALVICQSIVHVKTSRLSSEVGCLNENSRTFEEGCCGEYETIWMSKSDIARKRQIWYLKSFGGVLDA
jgi:hypothetical protein